MGRLGSREHGVCKGCGQDRTLDVAGGYCTPCHSAGRAKNSERIKEIEAASADDPLRYESPEESDEAAKERMRAHKAKDWRVGEGPSRGDR